MRFALIPIATLTLFGCSGQPQRSPTAPDRSLEITSPEPRSVSGFVSVVVLERNGSGACILDARVEIVRGQGVGRSVTQTAQCSYWDPDDKAEFNGLIMGEELTLRASAEGYATMEITTLPMRSGSALVVALSRN